MQLSSPLLSLTTLLLLSSHQCNASSTSNNPSSSATKDPFRDVIFASPLKTLTIFDKPSRVSARSRFLKKFQGGIESESRIRRAILGEERKKKKDEADGQLLEDDEEGYEEVGEYYQGSEWADSTQALEDSAKEMKTKRIQDAFEEGFNSVNVTPEEDTICSPRSQNDYQFTGVVMPHKGNKVKWYARKKPKNADWSVRMVHVDKAAVLRDLFVRGKVDIYAEYKNRGIPLPVEEEGDEVKKLGAIIEPKYTAKERSWRTLWNFSPTHFFTDRSGMFWRERRIRSGIYTDGQNVFESTYRYIEGRNGMTPLPGVDLSSFLDRYSDETQKQNILEKVETSTPDVVSES